MNKLFELIFFNWNNKDVAKFVARKGQISNYEDEFFKFWNF